MFFGNLSKFDRNFADIVQIYQKNAQNQRFFQLLNSFFFFRFIRNHKKYETLFNYLL